jgi:hypothetical protein
MAFWLMLKGLGFRVLVIFLHCEIFGNSFALKYFKK